ncbi:hypothetical protein [Streptomyces recifensis]|uniref:hypothetical protein n=1 Tax=Streptomyces recifensis TaxID=67355 RepID=UPI001FC98647|nr:hypothetical protein [Streptomyces recifensis]
MLTFVASLGLNMALVWSGVLDFSLWGWLFWIPVLAAEAKLRRAKKLGQERVVARIQARHDEARSKPSAGVA